MNTHIAVINQSTVVSDDDVAAAVPALQKQVHDDFAPAWGADATVAFAPQNKKPPAGAWWLVILDDSDQAGALGYHDLTNDGLPLSKVFAKSDQQYGFRWTVTTSHEMLEMLADPDINLTVFVQTSNTAGTLYAREVCDACEADALGYEVDGVLLSDFVYPAWFESFRKAKSTKFDHKGHLTKPFELATGGYIGAFDISAGSGWHQIQAS
ncbi:MAG TPA: hypothetical protein VHD87_17905, partial [Acidimicrobiales bacterium]|nr:hypothetical protein [Acidimicrobiales bacterium]